MEENRQLGPVTQDDPMPHGFDAYLDTSDAGDLTYVAVFTNVEEAESCSDDLTRRGIALEVSMVARRGDGPEQGLRPGNVITGPGYGASADSQSLPKDKPMGAGVAVGASIGATVGLLAVTYMIPPFDPPAGTSTLVSTLIGAGIGSFLGGIFEYGARDKQDDATIYPGTVRKGGVMLLVRTTTANSEFVRETIEFWSPQEIREQSDGHNK
jgi:hypothetical protein